MRASIGCVCLIGVLVLSTTGWSEIVSDGDWSCDYWGNAGATGNSGSSYSWASSEGDGWLLGGAEGWESETTTEAGIFSCSWYCYGEVWVGVWWRGEQERCSADAWAVGSVSIPGLELDSYDLQRSISGTYSWPDYDQKLAGGGGSYGSIAECEFDAYESIEGEHLALVSVSTPTGSDSLAEGTADATAWVDMQ